LRFCLFHQASRTFLSLVGIRSPDYSFGTSLEMTWSACDVTLRSALASEHRREGAIAIGDDDHGVCWDRRILIVERRTFDWARRRNSYQSGY
jgi:hypothetical protein